MFRVTMGVSYPQSGGGLVVAYPHGGVYGSSRTHTFLFSEAGVSPTRPHKPDWGFALVWKTHPWGHVYEQQFRKTRTEWFSIRVFLFSIVSVFFKGLAM
mmetsp:Transcript_32324/g.32636  ORF Transcript_32324/g.32636 Transcript_32324/m.32636 type:complete len:99 (-) Transcript_32324:379-675(-)